MVYILIAVFLSVLMVVYIKVAEQWTMSNIPSKPDHRGSPAALAIRGGGIIFPIAILISGIIHPVYLLPVAGAAVIGIISFLGDCFTISKKIQILFHLVAISMMFQFSPVFIIMPWWAILVLYLLVIGLIKGYNAMDGINGMTSIYSLVVLSSLQYVNIYLFDFIDDDLIWIPLIACAVFLCFHLLKKTPCIAGKAGSVTIAFWTVFLLLQFMFYSGNFLYILFLAVYLFDAIWTAIYRMVLRTQGLNAKQSVSHGVMDNTRDKFQWQISALYGFVQAAIIGFVVCTSL